MYKRILVPLDGSELAECSLEHVKGIALGCHVPEVVLLGVVEPANEAMPWSWGSVAAAQTQAERDMAEEKSATDYIGKIATRLLKEGINVITRVQPGRPAETILDYTAKNGVDLIIMATHGRGGVTRWDFGKVADRVIRTSSVPVLMASPKGCRV
jgi:nucleotide-binding universal stress UspA family protein